jgi:hypothetical protein
MYKIKYFYYIKQVIIYNQNNKIIFSLNLLTLKNSRNLFLELYNELKNKNMEHIFSNSCIKLLPKN